MNIREVLFLGGNAQTMASVQIRCIDIAIQLGCDYQLQAKHVTEVPDRYSAFVCVKPDLVPGELCKLAERGLVIWDIIDYVPPRENISIYLASSQNAQKLFRNFGRVELLRHHHCNASRAPNSPSLRRPSWIGSKEWHPVMSGFEYDYYDVAGMARHAVEQACRKTGIGLNLRMPKNQYAQNRLEHSKSALGYTAPRKFLQATRNLYDFHLESNSGIKLINCLGYGIPSISSDEPAYHEIGEDCTIFSSLKRCEHWVKTLQNDDVLYNDLRQKCIRRAPEFHIENISARYKHLLESL